MITLAAPADVKAGDVVSVGAFIGVAEAERPILSRRKPGMAIASKR